MITSIDLNKAADYLYYELGLNPIPAYTKIKKINIKWGEYHDKSVPVEIHEYRKKMGHYNNGIAVMTGRIHKGKHTGKYLIGIDCDNLKAIEEICIRDGKKITLQELGNWTRIEQHKDNTNKAHIYILSTKPFKNKGRDPKITELESKNQVPAIEVKCEHQTMFTAPSIHENGYPYEILGTKEPILCDEFENHLDNIFKKYGIEYLVQKSSFENNSNNTLPEPLRQLINWLEIPQDFQYRIHEGARHSTMLSFANKLLLKHKNDINISKDELKDFFMQVNDKLCSPPLPQNELSSIWRDSLKFSDKVMQDFKVINNDEEDYSNYNKPIVVPLQIGEELLKEDIVQSFVKDNQQNNLILEFNHKYPHSKIHIPITGPKKWLEFRKSFKQMLGEYEINKKHILLILKTLDSNYDLIIDKNNGSSDLYDSRDKEEKKHKREFIIYKYSQIGKGSLHEAVIVNGLPFFVKYDNESNSFELVENIEENSRILRPPNIEEYPYIQYSFESNEELASFMEKAREVTLDELFKFSKNIFLIFVDQDEYIIILLAADSIWTYFQDLFSATHYSEGIGDNDVGKSSIGYTFEYTAYRVVKGVAISGANYNKVLGSIEPGQCVIIEDEGDNISEDPDKVKILKSGYEYNGKVPKINMNTIDQEQKWFKTYGYKMILAEKSLKEYKVKGLVDRTFTFNCRPGKVKYSIKEVVSQNINKSPKLQKLYDELLSFRKLILCYRLIHYKDSLPEIETGLENRDNELCKPLLQLFYGTEALNKEIIPTLETFVKQRRTRKGNSLEAALYPIIKKYVFANAGLDYETNTYSDLNKKKTSVKVPFYEIWNYIKEGGIDGQYDEKKKYQYETVDYGTLYLNSLPTTISNKFTAEVKKQDYGKALIFDAEKLERFEDLYNSSQLKGDKVKIEVKLKETTDNYDDYDDFDNF